MGHTKFQKKISARIYCQKNLNHCCVRLYRSFDEVNRILNKDRCRKKKKTERRAY